MATTPVGANQSNHSGPVGRFSGVVKAPDGGQHRRYLEASADFRGSQVGNDHGALDAQLTPDRDYRSCSAFAAQGLMTACWRALGHQASSASRSNSQAPLTGCR